MLDQYTDMLGKKFSIFQQKIAEQKENSGECAEQVIKATKEEIDHLSIKIRQAAENPKNSIYAGLAKAQTMFEAKKTSLREKAAQRKAAGEKERARVEAENAIEYAAVAIDFAMLGLDEATLAFYEAIEKADHYEKIYGLEDAEGLAMLND